MGKGGVGGVGDSWRREEDMNVGWSMVYVYVAWGCIEEGERGR